ncbi:MAG TPA: penicillin-binding transpeptidase domain-containing protein [Solirubrobacterales bacterium]|nr:penicillin-binding transpeptidase domain-containing protein [Solirubrobacterales bacterium]
MNARISKLFGLVALLFALLVGFTSYWSVFESEELRGKQVNRRPLLEEQQIRRGTIRSADGEVLARSVGRGQGNSRIFTRQYPTADLFGHPIGYSFTERGRSQFESFHNDELTGEVSEFTSILDELRGGRDEGDNIVTTLYASAQQAAFDALAGQAGSVVAIEPATGKVRVMAAIPAYDPNTIPDAYAALNTDPASPLLDRSVQSGYPPGSTMKVVTAAAALDSGAVEPDSTLDGSSPVEIQGQPLANSGGVSYGELSLTAALTGSVNTAFARLGESIGTDTLYEYMDRFGFNADPEIDLPDSELFPSGVYDGLDRLGPDDPVDVARVAIGQERLLVTPLQMAEVAAAVANGGELMRPRLWDRVVDPDGRVVRRMEPESQSRVVSEETAAELNTMMQGVVNEGTGTQAALSGIEVAGKTGTAEVPGRENCDGLPNQAWFIGFAPASDPQIAVAATVECTSGQGGTVAAPIARAVIESVLATEG